MFEHLFSHPSTVARHRAAPYAAERERYLTYCARQGYAHTTLRLKARELLWIARKLRVYPDLHVTPAQLEAVASGWHDRQQGCGRPLNTRRARARFLAGARAWRRFLGGWCPSPRPSHWPSAERRLRRGWPRPEGYRRSPSGVDRSTLTTFSGGTVPGGRPWQRSSWKRRHVSHDVWPPRLLPSIGAQSGRCLARLLAVCRGPGLVPSRHRRGHPGPTGLCPCWSTRRPLLAGGASPAGQPGHTPARGHS